MLAAKAPARSPQRFHATGETDRPDCFRHCSLPSPPSGPGSRPRRRFVLARFAVPCPSSIRADISDVTPVDRSHPTPTIVVVDARPGCLCCQARFVRYEDFVTRLPARAIRRAGAGAYVDGPCSLSSSRGHEKPTAPIDYFSSLMSIRAASQCLSPGVPRQMTFRPSFTSSTVAGLLRNVNMVLSL